MSQVTTQSIAELLDQLGGIPAERVRLYPYPGTATEQDVTEIERRENRLCELVDGVLVEKTVGLYESHLAVFLIELLGPFVTQHDLGILTGADGALRLMPGLVRIPDVSFISWKRLPGRLLPAEPIPDLAVEVLSASNTEEEMKRKLREYFRHGVRLVWYIDPEARTATIYTSPSRSKVIHEDEALTGGRVLPGFTLPLRQLFSRAGRRQSER